MSDIEVEWGVRWDWDHPDEVEVFRTREEAVTYLTHLKASAGASNPVLVFRPHIPWTVIA